MNVEARRVCVYVADWRVSAYFVANSVAGTHRRMHASRRLGACVEREKRQGWRWRVPPRPGGREMEEWLFRVEV